MVKQKINCNVESCKYNDHDNLCTLSNIVVGSNSNCVSDKCDTECVSFEAE